MQCGNYEFQPLVEFSLTGIIGKLQVSRQSVFTVNYFIQMS